MANGGPMGCGAPWWCVGGRTSPVSGVWAQSTGNWRSCSASSQGAQESHRDTLAGTTMTRVSMPPRSCPSPRGGPPRDARIGEMVAAALGHAPQSGCWRSSVVRVHTQRRRTSGRCAHRAQPAFVGDHQVEGLAEEQQRGMGQACLGEQRPRAHRAADARRTAHTGAWAALGVCSPAHGQSWRCHGAVEIRLLRLTSPCTRAPGLSQGSLAAGPGDLRRHRAAQLVHHRVHAPSVRILQRQPQAQQIGHERTRDPPTALP